MERSEIEYKLYGIKSRFDERKRSRADANDKEKGEWITTSTGVHIHLNEEGVADKGPKGAVDAINETDKKKPASGKKGEKGYQKSGKKSNSSESYDKLSPEYKKFADKLKDSDDPEREAGYMIQTLKDQVNSGVPGTADQWNYATYLMQEYPNALSRAESGSSEAPSASEKEGGGKKSQSSNKEESFEKKPASSEKMAENEAYPGHNKDRENVRFLQEERNETLKALESAEARKSEQGIKRWQHYYDMDDLAVKEATLAMWKKQYDALKDSATDQWRSSMEKSISTVESKIKALRDKGVKRYNES